MTETREFVVSADEAGARLDVFLARHMPDWSRSQLQQQIRSGFVTIGSAAVYKAGEKVEAGGRVTIRASRHELRAVPEELPLSIVYEDGDLLVVDSTNNQVRRAPPAVSASTTAFITSGLSQPFGIARRGDGDIFVASLMPTGLFGPIVDLDYMTRGFAQFQMDKDGKLNLLRLSLVYGQAYEFRRE